MKKKNILKFLRYLLLVILAIIFLSPIIFGIISSFKGLGDIYDPDKVFSLRGLGFTSWIRAITEENFLHFLKNSLISSVISTILVLIFAIPAGFGLAKLRMSKKIRSNISFEFIAMRMLPPIAVIIPIFVIFSKIKLVYTMQGLILIYLVFNLPMAVWLLEGFFKEVPDEIIEAAKVDGSDPLSILFKIAVPLTAPGIVAVAILTYIFVWNEFMFASVLTTSAHRTLPVWAAFVTSKHYIIDFGLLSVAITVMIVPVVIFALIMQRHLVRGLSMGAIKE